MTGSIITVRRQLFLLLALGLSVACARSDTGSSTATGKGSAALTQASHTLAMRSPVVPLFGYPNSVTVDGSGNVYVGDFYDRVVRKLTPEGVVTTYAGRPYLGWNRVDGPSSQARFGLVQGVAADAAGNVYVNDTFSCGPIRKITLDGWVSTFLPERFRIEQNGVYYWRDMCWAKGMAVDGAGNLYVLNDVLFKLTPDGAITVVAGTLGANGYGSLFSGSWAQDGLATDSVGNVYVQEYGVIYVVTPAGALSIFASSIGGMPVGLAVDGGGNAYTVDGRSDTVNRIAPDGVVTTVAGSGTIGTADGTGTAAEFNSPMAVATDASGDLVVADTGNRILRKVTRDGVVTTIAGVPGVSGYRDGTVASPPLMSPWGVAVNGSGNALVTDSNAILMITPDGTRTVVAEIAGAAGAAVDDSGNFFVADASNHAIRRIAPDGTVTTIAGTLGVSGSADGSSALFNSPMGVAVDRAGNVYVADTGNHTIRRISRSGNVNTVAGMPGVCGSADGTGSAAQFCVPYAIAVDAQLNLYVADTGNETIRTISPAGKVTTIAGTAGVPGSADGAGASAQFSWPTGIAVDGSHNVYVSDQGNSTIRMITPGYVVSTVAGVAGQNETVLGPLPASIAAPVSIALDPTTPGKLVVTSYDGVLDLFL